MTTSFSHCFFINVHDFFGIDFRIDFFFVFFMKMAPKMNDPVAPGPPKKRYFSKPSLLYQFHVDVGSLWIPFWLTLAPFWLTVGDLWLSFGVLGLTFWCPWAHFW